MSVSDVSSCDGMTVLTLLPPGDGEKKKGDDELEKELRTRVLWMS